MTMDCLSQPVVTFSTGEFAMDTRRHSFRCSRPGARYLHFACSVGSRVLSKSVPLFAAKRVIFTVMAALSTTVCSRAAAQGGSSSVELPGQLRINPAVDLSLTIGGGALWLSAELLSSKISSASCRWCDRNSDGSDGLNGFDSSVRRPLRWSNTGTAGTPSDIFGFRLAPFLGTGVAAFLAYPDHRL